MVLEQVLGAFQERLGGDGVCLEKELELWKGLEHKPDE